MRLFADENMDGPIVAWLREQGHDVVWVAESAPGAEDVALIERAFRDDRLILTRDRDFGELVFRHGHRAAGIVLLRLSGRTADIRLTHFQQVWKEISEKIGGNFVVASPGRIRVRPLHENSGDNVLH